MSRHDEHEWRASVERQSVNPDPGYDDFEPEEPGFIEEHPWLTAILANILLSLIFNGFRM